MVFRIPLGEHSVGSTEGVYQAQLESYIGIVTSNIH